jgi:hypothetical protein
MAIDIPSSGFKALFQTLKIFFRLPNDLHFGLCGVYPRKSMGRDNTQKANTFFSVGSQFFDPGDNIFSTS